MKGMSEKEIMDIKEAVQVQAPAIKQWLKSVDKQNQWTFESCGFLYLLELYNDLNDMELLKKIR